MEIDTVVHTYRWPSRENVHRRATQKSRVGERQFRFVFALDRPGRDPRWRPAANHRRPGKGLAMEKAVKVLGHDRQRISLANPSRIRSRRDRHRRCSAPVPIPSSTIARCRCYATEPSPSTRHIRSVVNQGIRRMATIKNESCGIGNTLRFASYLQKFIRSCDHPAQSTS